MIRLLISTSVVAGTELTIRWNKISGVDTASSAGQLIPLCLGVAAVVRVIYKAMGKSSSEQQAGPVPQHVLPSGPTRRQDIDEDMFDPTSGIMMHVLGSNPVR